MKKEIEYIYNLNKEMLNQYKQTKLRDISNNEEKINKISKININAKGSYIYFSSLAISTIVSLNSLTYFNSASNLNIIIPALVFSVMVVPAGLTLGTFSIVKGINKFRLKKEQKKYDHNKEILMVIEKAEEVLKGIEFAKSNTIIASGDVIAKDIIDELNSLKQFVLRVSSVNPIPLEKEVELELKPKKSLR